MALPSAAFTVKSGAHSGGLATNTDLTTLISLSRVVCNHPKPDSVFVIGGEERGGFTKLGCGAFGVDHDHAESALLQPLQRGLEDRQTFG